MAEPVRIVSSLLAAAVALAGAEGSFAAEKSVLAVFDIHDARAKGKMSAQELQQLTHYLMAKLAEGSSFKIVPRDQVLAAIAAQKKDTYKACFDEQCQIELGKELAAEKSLGTQIIRIGDRCVITSTLYDLKTAVSERAATKRSACDANAVADALDAVADALNHGQSKPAVVVNAGGEGEKTAVTGGEKTPPKEEGLKPPRFEDAGMPFLDTADGRSCAGGDGDACSRAANDLGSTRSAWRHADRGCQAGHAQSCQWAAKVAFDLGDKGRANGYARYGCEALNDPGGCSWYAKIEQEIGSKSKALEVATYNCNTRNDGPNCAWAANISYGSGNKSACRDFAQRGCAENDAEACSWIIKLEYEARNLDTAFQIAKSGCEGLKHGSSCSWAGTIQYELGNKNKSLEFAGKGCTLNDATACEWSAKTYYELGLKHRALEVGSRACAELKAGVACSWAASIDYEFGHRAKALDWAIKGCAYQSPDSCGWKRKIEAELAAPGVSN